MGERVVVHFAGGEGQPGDLTLELRVLEPARMVWTVIEDATHVSHWLDVQEAEVTWAPSTDGRTEVCWTLRYERLLDPAWYFQPLERYAVGLAASYLIESLGNPREAE